MHSMALLLVATPLAAGGQAALHIGSCLLSSDDSNPTVLHTNCSLDSLQLAASPTPPAPPHASPALPPPVYKSCKALLEAEPMRFGQNGFYTIESMGTVWCDMTIAGGGWTAIFNPTSMSAASPFGAPTVTRNQGSSTSSNGGALQIGYTVLENPNGCGPNANLNKDATTGFYQFQGYACGVQKVQWDLRWTNSLDATDVAFHAHVQGENEASLALMGTNVPETGATDPHSESSQSAALSVC